MISKRNIKLGEIPNWSLPPKESCPGRTEDTVINGVLEKGCSDLCYVGGRAGYLRVFKSAGVAYEKNLDSVLLNPEWKVEVMRFLSKRQPPIFRIHVSGDFFSPKYIGEWGQIMAMFPNTRFLAYTRSWRLPRLRKELNRLRNQQANFSCFASLDGVAHNAPKGWRQAWMGQPRTEEKAVLCPGYGPKELTCDKCTLCFRDNKVNVYFPIH
jgi:hypothetical protein